MKFIADIMVGKLARYLRMAGHDVAYFNDASDDLILETAMKEGRIVLTRDTLMLERRQFRSGALKSVFISDDDSDAGRAAYILARVNYVRASAAVGWNDVQGLVDFVSQVGGGDA